MIARSTQVPAPPIASLRITMSDSPASPRIKPRIGVVFGGGALKGLAHVGALRALEEAGIQPRLYAGTSIGAMIAAAAALPPLPAAPSSLRTSASAVDAVASTLAPSSEMTLA